MVYLAKNIITLRQEKGLTQAELAYKTGLKQQSISRWEQGMNMPGLEDCVALAEYFEVSLDELIRKEL